jgi:hypothetical protein
MDKIKEIAKEKTTWTLGVPSIVLGVLSILKDDNAQAVTDAVHSAGEVYANTGDWKTGAGFLLAGIMGIFLKAR